MPQDVSPSSAACAPVPGTSEAGGSVAALLDADADRAGDRHLERLNLAALLGPDLDRRRTRRLDHVARARLEPRAAGTGAADRRPRSRTAAASPPSRRSRATAARPPPAARRRSGGRAGTRWRRPSSRTCAARPTRESRCSRLWASSCTSSHGISNTSVRNASSSRWRDTALWAISWPSGVKMQVPVLVARRSDRRRSAAAPSRSRTAATRSSRAPGWPASARCWPRRTSRASPGSPGPPRSTPCGQSTLSPWLEDGRPRRPGGARGRRSGGCKARRGRLAPGAPPGRGGRRATRPHARVRAGAGGRARRRRRPRAAGRDRRLADGRLGAVA